MTWPVVIAVAPNGARRQPADHPALPVTTEAIARTVAACVHAGAAMVHLHVRDARGNHSLDAGRYREAIAAIRQQAASEPLIQITTEAGARYRPAQQRACVRALLPTSASLALRELASDATEARATGHLLKEMLEAGAIPQLILYHPEELDHYRRLQANDTFPRAELPLLFVLGSHTDETPRAGLEDFLAGPVGDACWMVCAFGRHELPAVRKALRLGGQVRLGFENNLWHPQGRPLRDNAESVALAVRAAHALGRTPADAATARHLLTPPTATEEVMP
ncbi:MAG: 3-keto-5-aminohexanoate cleavage protein [Gammaproteobacteria bacterium]|nr:MAG: 3-keto-5-aminohexanoate cleavage protein [Gammaproteobacteria bacterium]